MRCIMGRARADCGEKRLQIKTRTYLYSSKYGSVGYESIERMCCTKTHTFNKAQVNK